MTSNKQTFNFDHTNPAFSGRIKTCLKEISSFRPYIVGEKAYVSVRDNIAPIECARFTRDQWVSMDQTVVSVSRPLLYTLNKLCRDGLCFYRPMNYAENGVLFIHKDCDASNVSWAACAVATKVEQVVQYVFNKGSIEQLYVFLDMTLIQKSPKRFWMWAVLYGSGS